MKGSKILHDFGLFIFNKNKKEVLGRTWQSWAKISGFFFVLYAVLAGIFAIHLTIFIVISPQPADGVQPWNFGQYGYQNYPNSKIVLVSYPNAFTYKRGDKQAVLSQNEEKYIQKIMASANTSGVSSECLMDLYGYDIGEPCIFVHVLKVHQWTPDLINSTLRDVNTLLVKCSFTSSNLDLNITSTAEQGIPLNLSNTDSRSFPFTGQPGYITPVMAIKLNLTNVTSETPNVFKGVVTCSIDLEGMGLPQPSNEMLERLYEIPADSSTKITFRL